MVNLELINNLWLQIDKVHLSYLQTEESLQRIEQKKKLEGLILPNSYLLTKPCNFILA